MASGYPTLRTVKRILMYLEDGPLRFDELAKHFSNRTWLSHVLNTLKSFQIVIQDRKPTEAGYGFYKIWRINPKLEKYSIDQLVAIYRYIRRMKTYYASEIIFILNRKKDYAVLTIYLRRDLYKKLLRIAKEDGISISNLLKNLIVDFLKEKRRK